MDALWGTLDLLVRHHTQNTGGGGVGMNYVMAVGGHSASITGNDTIHILVDTLQCSVIAIAN